MFSSFLFRVDVLGSFRCIVFTLIGLEGSIRLRDFWVSRTVLFSRVFFNQYLAIMSLCLLICVCKSTR